MTEAKLRKDMERAERAKRVLENELVKEAIEVIKTNVRTAWESSKANDKEGREEAWKMLKVVNEFERHFVNLVTSGKMAEKELSRLEQMGEKVRSMFR